MIRILLAVGVAFLLAACSPQSPKVEQLTSPEGHAFTYLSVPEANKISVQIAWPTDWNMRAETNKAVPFIGAELMLSGGAGDMDASALLEGFNDTNSEGHIVPTADYVRGILTIDKDHRDKAVAIANAVLTKPRLDENWLGRIAGNLEDRYAQASAQPSQMGWQAVRSAILGTSPVQQALSMLDKQTVEAVTRDDVEAWREQTFVTAGATIVVTGPVLPTRRGNCSTHCWPDCPTAKRLQNPTSRRISPPEPSFCTRRTPRKRPLVSSEDCRQPPKATSSRTLLRSQCWAAGKDRACFLRCGTRCAPVTRSPPEWRTTRAIYACWS